MTYSLSNQVAHNYITSKITFTNQGKDTVYLQVPFVDSLGSIVGDYVFYTSRRTNTYFYYREHGESSHNGLLFPKLCYVSIHPYKNLSLIINFRKYKIFKEYFIFFKYALNKNVFDIPLEKYDQSLDKIIRISQ